MKKELEIYTDGACTKNPGGSGGYGCVLVTDKNNPVKVQGYIPSPTTSNRAEIMAVIVGVFHAQTLGYKDLHIFSDSKYVVNTILGIYSKNKNNDLWDLLGLSLSTLKSLKCTWVRGHNGNIYNELADKLAVNGSKLYIEQESNKPSGVTVTDLGLKMRPKMTAVDVNKLLIKYGYQIRNQNKTYSPTDKGKPFSIVDEYVDYNGQNYIRLTWLYEVVNELQKELNSN